MTNELEKQFFDTFGIEPEEEKYCYWECKKPELENVACNNTECEHYRHKIHYPTITDSIYLMLLATLTCISSIEFPFSDIQKLKEDILKEVIKHQYGFDKHQVRTLFEEG